MGEFHEGYLKVGGGLQESLVRTGIMVQHLCSHWKEVVKLQWH